MTDIRATCPPQAWTRSRDGQRDLLKLVARCGRICCTDRCGEDICDRVFGNRAKRIDGMSPGGRPMVIVPLKLVRESLCKTTSHLDFRTHSRHRRIREEDCPVCFEQSRVVDNKLNGACAVCASHLSSSLPLVSACNFMLIQTHTCGSILRCSITRRLFTRVDTYIRRLKLLLRYPQHEQTTGYNRW